MYDRNSLVAKYLLALSKYKNQLLSISNRIVADAYFSKESFVTGAIDLGFNVISRPRNDARLMYLYTGDKTGKRGRPQEFNGRVDLKELDMKVFTKEEITVDSDKTVVLYSAFLRAVALKRNVKIVVIDCEDEDRKTISRKVFFSTDVSMSAQDIFSTYRSRFQIEFLYRDAKGFTGLTHCQARDEKRLDFHFNTSLTAVNIARVFCRNYEKLTGKKISIASVKLLLHNATLVERIFLKCGQKATNKINNTIVKELIMYGVRDAA